MPRPGGIQVNTRLLDAPNPKDRCVKSRERHSLAMDSAVAELIPVFRSSMDIYSFHKIILLFKK